MKHLTKWINRLSIRFFNFISDLIDPNKEIRSSPFFKSTHKSMLIDFEEKKLAKIIKKVLIKKEYTREQAVKSARSIRFLNQSLFDSIKQRGLSEEAYKMYIEENIKSGKLLPDKDLDLLSEEDLKKELISSYEVVLKNESYSRVVWTFISTMFGGEMGVNEKHDLAGELLFVAKSLSKNFSKEENLKVIKKLREDYLGLESLVMLIFDARLILLVGEA